jgi:arsenite methyltransferase
MAATCPTGFDVDQLRAAVRATYERVARDPAGDFHFHRGIDYACEYLGYDRHELAALPEVSTARFAGVGNPLRLGAIGPGQTVLDHACGAGMDLLLAAKRTGPWGRAIGVDMTAAMRECAAAAATKAGLAKMVEVRAGLLEDLPVDDESVDVVISNGVVNLSPDKTQVFKEIYRVLRPGGRLFLADVVVQRELTLAARSNPDLWAACLGGALTEPELYELSTEAGLSDGSIIQRFDCFHNTSAANRISEDLQVQGLNFFARKPLPS